MKPAEARAIVLRRTYAPGPGTTLSAVADLLDLDGHFHLFAHARGEEDVVVHWRDDHRIGLLFPPGSVLADEDDIVVPRLMHRFLCFVDAGDGRGRVLYLRVDGDYGLVQPW